MRGRGVVLVVFFVSGVSALLYQVAWLKYLGFVFGNTVHAAATLIAVFLAGLGIGGYLFGRFLHRANALILYGVLEALVGALGAFSPNAFALLDDAYVAAYPSIAHAPVGLALFRIVAASLFLLPPTILMGGTLPVLVRYFSGERLATGRAISSLYAANTFGATSGVALSGFYLIPAFGLTATVAIAVGLNFLLAATAIGFAWLARADGGASRGAPDARRRDAATAGGTPALQETDGTPAPTIAVVAAFLLGFGAIANEVFWSRILVLHLGSSVYAYSLMLFCFLTGLALGSALVYRVIERANLDRLLGGLALALGIALALQVHFFTRFADVLEGFARAITPAGAGETLAVFLLATLSALLIPTALMGATFPVVVKIYSLAAAKSETRSVGVVYLANTVGSIGGSLLAGFVLIRVLGSQNGLFFTALLSLAIGIAFLLRGGRSRGAVAAAVAGVAVLAISFAAARPDAVILSAGLFADRGAPVLLFREDVSATVTLRELGPENLSLELNGVNVAGTAPDLIGTQKLQGHLPLLIHPNPKKVLHIGFGSGGTAYAVSRHPVEEIVIAEISPEVLEVSDRALRRVNHGVLEDPRVRAEINDGRNFVLASPETFDVILSDSIHPRYAGNGSLYTKDYFELCRRRLAPGGVISMWLPMYSLTTHNYLQIVRAFREVFPNTTVWYVPNVPNSFTIVIGRLEEGPIPFDRMAGRIRGPIEQELAEIGLADPYALASALMAGPDGAARMTASVEPHVDDLPSVEYESGRLIDRDLSWYRNFVLLARSMTALAPAFAGGDPDAMARAQKARDARILAHVRGLGAALARRASGI
ncbi:MAG TPA: fused MFS/spermidine synthase [Thermoanaerobaculia bacterium]